MDDTSEYPLPGDRAFALARRYAMATKEHLTIAVTDACRPVCESTAPFASVAALVALKAVAMPRRANSNHPEKVASDIHDLIRLVTTADVDDLAARLRLAGPELAAWVAATLVHWFSADADQRYTFARLRRLSNTVDARAVDEDEPSLVAGLGQAVLDAFS